MIGKLYEIALPPVCAISMAIGISAAAFADDYYVSSDGNYGIAEGANADHRFTDLQAAVTAASSAETTGHTVWVDDGFECAQGSTTDSKRTVRLAIPKAMTVRGKSGDWRKGPIIWGDYATGGSIANPATCCGADAVTCVGGAGLASVKLIGLRLMRGATQKPTSASDPGYGGGASGVTLENCLVADCVASWRGGGVVNSDTIDCVISNCHCVGTTGAGRGSEFGGGSDGNTHTRTVFWNCYSANMGGAIRGGKTYDCVMTNCTSGSYGGATQGTSCYGTKIYGGTAPNGGGAGYQSNFFDGCLIYGCAKGAVVAGNAIGTCFERNVANASGSAYVFKGLYVVSNCTFIANETPAVAGSQATTGAKIVDSVLTGNAGTSISIAMQNGGELIISNCTITCSDVNGAAVSSSRYNKDSTRVQRFAIYDCDISGPVRGNGDVYNTIIRGFSGSGATVKCNLSDSSYADPPVPLNLYNCTVTENRSSDSAGGVQGDFVNAYNTIIRGNTGKMGVTDTLKTAVNCCLEDAAMAIAETATDCIRVDPELFVGTGGYLYPLRNSPCRSSGSLTAYALPPKDLAGQPRTSNGGTTVAIGACEYDPTFVGATITCVPEVQKAPASGTFVVTSSGLGEDGLTYYWDFEGDGTIDLVTNETSCAYLYPVEGEYMATVFVSNDVAGTTAMYPMSIVDGYFVSTKNIHEVPGRTGGWGVYTAADGHEHLAYTNLQQAIDAAGVGDVVWVDDDFVCDEGVAGNNARINIQKTLTVRGRSGDGRTGPVIRGAYHTADTPCGANAVRCVYANLKNVYLIGLKLVGGATQAAANVPGSGGGAYNCTLENCWIEDCRAHNYGGGVRDCDTKNCVFEGCEASGASNTYGGGAYSGFHDGSVFVDCIGGQGGGVRSGEVVDCVFTNCSATFGAAVAAGKSARRCVSMAVQSSMAAGAVRLTCSRFSIAG